MSEGKEGISATTPEQEVPPSVHKKKSPETDPTEIFQQFIHPNGVGVTGNPLFYLQTHY
ncbi:MAG TPA: hypothetical protein VI957_01090 [Candidatus Paceibacterota bacterium]